MSPKPPYYAQQFVIVGTQLKVDLQKQELFNNYFEDKQDRLKFIEHVDKLNTDDYSDLATTLFIVRHFDFDPNQKDDNQNHRNAQNRLNNNHIVNRRLFKAAGEESEAESVGYTTDYDEIDEEQMDTSQVAVDSSDYDGGYCFNLLLSYKCCMMGSIALLQTIRHLKSLGDPIEMIPKYDRPLHNLAMRNVIITFSGFISKTEQEQLFTLARYMNASTREKVTTNTTHVVAQNSRGKNYRGALEFGKLIMNTTWVRESFRLAQNNLDFEADMQDFVQLHKMKPFYDLRLAFLGFKDDDVKELCELTKSNEGTIVDLDDLTCTHIVVDAISGIDDTNNQLLNSINQKSDAYVVYKEWFWASLEMEGKVGEDSYAVPGYKLHRRSSRLCKTPTSNNNSLSNLLSPLHGLDYSRSPDSMSAFLDKKALRSQSVSNLAKDRIDLSSITPRHRACLELLQTEKNYVRILDTIVNLFKLPLENSDAVDPILPFTDVKIIFGNLTPIHEVHKKILSNLENLIENGWKETNCIGRVFFEHSLDLLKAYPPFVNFFEDTKKTINSCDEKYPRFHAFLKKCQSKSECNRESLTEMIIRPVQRLPSISLIITELIKRTEDSNPDKKYLNLALESIRKVMNLINEDKRKTEGQIAMFDIVNNIEDCPPNLLSALRKFICKVEARLMYSNGESEVIPSTSHKVVLFLFSDLIEICKIRQKKSHSFRGTRTYVTIGRSINSAQAAKLSNKKDKEHRHLDELYLCDIMNIYKKCQSSEMNDAIVIQARPSQRYDQNFRYYPFMIDDPSVSKEAFIKHLEENLSNCNEPDEVTEYVRNDDLPPISNDEIDFGYSNLLVNSMEKSQYLKRARSMRMALFSPSLKQRNISRINSRVI